MDSASNGQAEVVLAWPLFDRGAEVGGVRVRDSRDAPPPYGRLLYFQLSKTVVYTGSVAAIALRLLSGKGSFPPSLATGSSPIVLL
jgi:hypothetical protein